VIDPLVQEVETVACADTLSLDDGESSILCQNVSVRPWRAKARPAQIAPEIGDWDHQWYLRGSRRSGKTWAGGNHLADLIVTEPPGEWAIVAPTFGDARDTCVESMRSGLLIALGAHIGAGGVIRTPGPYIRPRNGWNRTLGQLYLRNGSVVFCDGADDGALRIQGKGLSGAWCLARGERVLTARGDVPIEQVRPGDRAMTRRGWRSVSAVVCTNPNAAVLRIVTSDGRSLRCTPEHQVWSGGGWKPAATLHVGDTLQATVPEYPKAASSITATVIGGTISPAILSSCRGQTTSQSTAYSASHTHPRYARRSAGRRPRRGLFANLDRTTAPIAGMSSCPPASEPSSARRRVESPTTVRSIEWDGIADVYDLTVDGEHEFFANGILVKNCDEIGLWKQWKTAFDESLRFAVTNPPAKLILTGTPKKNMPARVLVRRLIDDPKVAKSLLQMTANVANLDATMVEDLMSMRGTVLGQQELFGELIDYTENALWSFELIEAARVADIPEGVTLVRVVVAIDPAASAGPDSDETGIIVVGLGSDGHGYVLADLSGRYSPDGWARRAVNAYYDYRADRIVGEINNGGDMIGHTIHTVDADIAYRKVTATRGKTLRAEPVAACYEQHRVHHVGPEDRFTELEQQMVQMVPGEEQEHDDRVDGLVYALTELGMVGPGMAWDEVYTASSGDKDESDKAVEIDPWADAYGDVR
jgi:predicted phage terminase large subunit-like protein